MLKSKVSPIPSEKDDDFFTALTKLRRGTVDASQRALTQFRKNNVFAKKTMTVDDKDLVIYNESNNKDFMKPHM